jgi:DNA-binding CsgD family transcriptional regulator
VEVVGDKFFTGAYMDVGFWEKDIYNKLKYTSLLPSFPGDVSDGEQFWHIENIGETVIIQSFDAIYLYNISSKSVKVLETPKGQTILNLYKVNNEIFYFIPESGLYRVSNASGELIIPSASLDGSEIVMINRRNDGIELVTRTGNFYKWEEGVVESIYKGISEKLKNVSLFSALVLEDETFLLGSVENGLYQIDREGNVLQHYNQERGLQNNTVLSLFSDAEENIWVGLDNGLSVININSPFRLFHDNVGKIGTVYTSYQDEDYLYLGTNQGLYFRKNSEEKFTFLEGTNGQVWSIQEINGDLLCGHNNGTFLIEGENAQKISKRQGTWIVKDFLPRENVYIQGHYNGFSFLKKTSEGFEDVPLVNDFPHSSKHIVSKANGEIWIGNEHKGVFKLKLEDSLQKIEYFQNYPFENSIGITSSIFEFKDAIYYSSRENIFLYDRGNDVFTKNNKLARSLTGINRISGRIFLQNEKLWAFSEQSVLSIAQSELNEDFFIAEIFIPKELRTIPQGYENISHLGSNKYLLGLIDGYLIFKEDFEDSYSEENIRIENVLKSTLEEDSLYVPLAGSEPLHYRSNNLKFNYSIPEYRKFTVPVFSYRLTGLSDRWSSWNSSTTATFKNLPFGDYSFEVRGKVGNTLIPASSFSFEIARPWYWSNLAIAVYLLLFLVLLYIIHQVYKREHEKRIRENEKALLVKNLEAEQEIIKLKNERLEKEMESKNKELAVSTMSLIKKNEFLSKIKEQLKANGNAPQVKTVIKTIDKDISEEDNWKFFKKAFNNADKDFFKKIKSRHPDLTSTDLKLCAYLRLNLSSKEIAPLLNISVKSVEIKRYRLRKKMDLPHEKNLTDYILEI